MAIESPPNLDRLRRTLKETVNDRYTKLEGVVENSLEGFAALLFQERVVTRSVLKSASYNKIINEFFAGMSFLQSVGAIEEHCLKLLHALEDVGGPATAASSELHSAWTRVIREKFHLEFLSGHP